MSDAAVVASYRRAFGRRGRWVKVRRVTAPAGQGAGFVDATVKAIVMDYEPQGVVMPIKREGAITQGARKVMVMESDLAALHFPLPVKKNDKIILLEEFSPGPGATGIVLPGGAIVYEGDALNVTDPDPSKRRVAGAIELLAVGA